MGCLLQLFSAIFICVFNCFLFIWLLVLFETESHYEPWLAWNSLYRPFSVARLKACVTKPISLPFKKKKKCMCEHVRENKHMTGMWKEE